MASEDRCVVCGDIIPEGRQVCHKCEAMPVLVLKNKTNDRLNIHYCPNCKLQMPVGINYCWDCGQRLDWSILDEYNVSK